MTRPAVRNKFNKFNPSIIVAAIISGQMAREKTAYSAVGRQREYQVSARDYTAQRRRRRRRRAWIESRPTDKGRGGQETKTNGIFLRARQGQLSASRDRSAEQVL